MRAAILTGGGDVPGLNPCIKAAAGRFVEAGGGIIGVRRGWGGLLHCNPDDPESLAANTISLDLQRVRTVDRTGGTFLHTSRTNPGRVADSEVPDFLRDQVSGDGPHDLTPHILRVLESLGPFPIQPMVVRRGALDPHRVAAALQSWQPPAQSMVLGFAPVSQGEIRSGVPWAAMQSVWRSADQG